MSKKPFVLKLCCILLLLLMVFPAVTLADEAVISSVGATSWILGKDPTNFTPYKMIDGDQTTSYQFSTKTTPLGQAYVYFYFSSPFDVSTLLIKNGFWSYYNGNDLYVRNCRIRSMTVDFKYASSSYYTDGMTVTLQDDKTRADWTRINLGMHYNVVSVRFLILDIYTGTAYPNDVCISEVKFTNGNYTPSYSPTYPPSSYLYGLATMKLATRTGPGTTYTEGGTYNVAGQYIRILSRAWDSRNEIWWVKCEIPYQGSYRVLWTGYKRFDSSTIPLESIPIEYVY